MITDPSSFQSGCPAECQGLISSSRGLSQGRYFYNPGFAWSWKDYSCKSDMLPPCRSRRACSICDIAGREPFAHVATSRTTRVFRPGIDPKPDLFCQRLSGTRRSRDPGLLDLLRREIESHEASILILDGLVSVEETAGSSREYKKFIHQLQAQAALADCTVFLLSSSRPVAVEHTMVDGVIQLQSKLYGRRAERHLEVYKMRGTGYLRGEHSYQITDQGVIVYPRTEALLRLPSGQTRSGRRLQVELQSSII